MKITSTNRKFLYLVQGSAQRISALLPLKKRPSADYLFLTYDQPMEGALFFGRCTWGQGRNALAAHARKAAVYEYYIFLDDDVEFAKGSYDRFEELLLQKHPAVACPVFVPKTIFTPLGIGKGLLHRSFRCVQTQPLYRGDCQVTALHRSVFEDGLLFPVQDRLDAISYWCTSATIQILARTVYGRHALQINPVVVLNLIHRPYDRKAMTPEFDNWLNRQFRHPVSKPEEYVVNPFSADGRERIRRVWRGPLPRKYRLFLQWIPIFIQALVYRPKDSYGLSPEKLAAILKPDSDLYKQYLSLSPRAKPPSA